MKAKSWYLLWVVIGSGGLLWAVFVWPTPWNHYKQGSTNLRVNRFTGRTELLERNGWQEDRPQGKSPHLPPGVVDLGALQAAFPTPTLEVMTTLQKIKMSARYRQFDAAAAELDRLSKFPDISEAQKKSVADAIEKIKVASTQVPANPSE